MTEKAIQFGSKNNLFGVISEPDKYYKRRTALILLNTGMDHKAGSRRLNVKLARRLAVQGYSVLRFDLSGIGDSAQLCQGMPKIEQVNEDIGSAISMLKEDFGISSLIVYGVCTGADFAYRTILTRSDLSGAILVNGNYLPTDNRRKYREMAKNQYRSNQVLHKAVFQPFRWKRLFTGKIPLSAKDIYSMARRAFIGKPKLENTSDSSENLDDIVSGWDTLHRKNAKIEIVYSDNDVRYEQFKIAHAGYLQRKNYRNISIEIIQRADHTFACTEAQETFINRVTNWLIRNAPECTND